MKMAIERLYEQIYAKIYWYAGNISLVAVTLCFVGIFVLLSLISWQRKKLSWSEIGYITCFSVWVTIIISVTLSGRSGGTVNSVGSVFTSFEQLFSGNLGILYDMIFNIILFIPLGILIALKIRKSAVIVLIFGISFLIECFQGVLACGLFEIADLMNNTIGGMVGLFLGGKIRIIIDKYMDKKRNAGGRCY